METEKINGTLHLRSYAGMAEDEGTNENGKDWRKWKKNGHEEVGGS